jgi:hypothetical protein
MESNGQIESQLERKHMDIQSALQTRSKCGHKPCGPLNRHTAIILIMIIGIGICTNSCTGLGEVPQALTPTEKLNKTVLVRTETPAPPSPTGTGTPIRTEINEPTHSTTPVPRIMASINTNCRAGPGEEYFFKGVLRGGDTADVLGKSVLPDYWFVTHPDLPPGGCWIWGDSEAFSGDLDQIPVFTAMPSPTPAVGFDVYAKSFTECGSAYSVVFAVNNMGGERIWSGYLEVEDLSTGETLHRSRERHPFATSVLPACPPGHGNELWPGETRFIHVPISPVNSGNLAVGIITLCTADHQGGSCLTEYSYFQIP